MELVDSDRTVGEDCPDLELAAHRGDHMLGTRPTPRRDPRIASIGWLRVSEIGGRLNVVSAFNLHMTRGVRAGGIVYMALNERALMAILDW